jgi:hypothetical protein
VFIIAVTASSSHKAVAAVVVVVVVDEVEEEVEEEVVAAAAAAAVEVEATLEGAEDGIVEAQGPAKSAEVDTKWTLKQPPRIRSCRR